jgi:uncharacterized protein (DUF58 family)
LTGSPCRPLKCKEMYQDFQETREPTIFLVPLMRIMVAAALFIALLNGQHALALLAILVLAVTSGARLWSRFSRRALSCVSGLDTSRAFPGETLLLRVEAVNAKFLPVLLRVTIGNKGIGLFLGKDEPLSREIGLLWNERASFRWELTAGKRGVYSLGAVSVKVSDLLGFFPREIGRPENIEIIVYPRIHALKDISLPRSDIFGTAGEKSPLQDPVYLLGTREYQPSRPARYIHWKASAHRSLLQEKLFQPSEQEKVLFVFQVKGFQEGEAGEAFEEAIETAASLAVHLEGKGCAEGLVTDAQLEGEGSPVLPVGRSAGQTTAILETLARIRNNPVRDLTETIERGLRITWGTGCIYFTRDHDAASPVLLEFFRRRRMPVLHLVSRDAATAPGEGNDGLLEQLAPEQTELGGGRTS